MEAHPVSSTSDSSQWGRATLGVGHHSQASKIEPDILGAVFEIQPFRIGLDIPTYRYQARRELLPSVVVIQARFQRRDCGLGLFELLAQHLKGNVVGEVCSGQGGIDASSGEVAAVGLAELTDTSTALDVLECCLGGAKLFADLARFPIQVC